MPVSIGGKNLEGLVLSRFQYRFRGLERSHGTYELGGQTEQDGTKKKGKARTIHQPLTDEDWESHLSGAVGLGICPVREDSTCVFGAIDVDEYDLDLVAEEKRVRDLGLPLVVCRTKSGGAHLYLFADRPIPAKLVRQKLSEWSVALHHPGAEVFPKQDRLLRPEDAGSWINLPYFGGTRTTRYAISDGRGLTMLEFLDLTDRMVVSPKTLKLIRPKLDSILEGAPPCLERLLSSGVGEGLRNEVAFAAGIFCRKKFESGWEQMLFEFNLKYFDPPLNPQELGAVAKSVETKEYSYSCKHTALSSVCDRNVCLQRKFGVGGASCDPGVLITGLIKIKTDPPTWTVTVENGKVFLQSAEDLLTQKRFSCLCMEQLNVLPRSIKPQAWEKIVRDLLDGVTEIDAPRDASVRGQFLLAIDYFVTERPRARTREELLLGKAWAEDGTVYFRSSDLMKFLETSKIRNVTPRQAWTMLGDSGATTKKFKIKQKLVRCWGVSMGNDGDVGVDPMPLEGVSF